jgi:hypothetical protein
MSWLFSQALVEEFSQANSLDGEQFVPSSGSSTQQAYCAPDKMTDFSRLSRFGMTYKPLTDNLGAAVLTWYLGDSPAKTLAPQEKGLGSTESEAGCGEKWHASFTKYDPGMRLWKTHQCSLLGDLELYSETWPQWGLMRGGECWEQQTLEQTIRGTGSGLSPNGVDSFHTPNTNGLDGGSNSRRALRKKMDTWPTPCATDYKGSGQTGQLRDRLDYAAERGATKSKTYNWPTPRTKGMCGGTGSWELLKKNTTIEEARQMGAGNGGQLNPTWVEWLMGWPLGWTDLKPLATDKSPCVPQQLGES